MVEYRERVLAAGDWLEQASALVLVRVVGDVVCRRVKGGASRTHGRECLALASRQASVVVVLLVMVVVVVVTRRIRRGGFSPPRSGAW